MASILRSANIAYVKWDMNRQLSDLGSTYLGAEEQQELFHRYVLGVYALQERLVTEFPDLLWKTVPEVVHVSTRVCYTIVHRSGVLMTQMPSSV